MSGLEKKDFTAVDMLPPHLKLFKAGKVQSNSSSSSEMDFPEDHVRLESVSHDKKHSSMHSCPPLQREVNLAKMGFTRESTIDWSNIDLPSKTDLHKILHYKISNYINPDLFVKIGNHEYRCHHLVLQCYSSYFLEKSESRLELPEENVSKTAFLYIYDWMLHIGGDSYTLLRRDNILEIFMAAQFLQVKELEEQCWAFIDNEDLFSEANAFMLYLDARALHNTPVMELMVPRIQRFFLTLVASKDFLELVIEEISVFLRSNYICIHCEMEVFMSAVRWLMFDWEKRQKYLLEVMLCVRFGLISPWQLVDIRRNPENQEFLLVTRDQDVSRMIEDGLAFATVKSWYGQDASDYTHWIEVLGLTEPLNRNWAGTHKVSDQKRYNTYQEFQADLVKYRQIQMLALREREEKTSTIHSESQVSSQNGEGTQINTEDLILPHPRK